MGCEKEKMEKRRTGIIVFWKMANGHKHSFLTYEEDWKEDTNVAGGYYFDDGREVKTQGEYFEYIEESERTYLEGAIEEIECKSKQSLEEAKEEGWIEDYDFDVNRAEIIFF